MELRSTASGGEMVAPVNLGVVPLHVNEVFCDGVIWRAHRWVRRGVLHELSFLEVLARAIFAVLGLVVAAGGALAVMGFLSGRD